MRTVTLKSAGANELVKTQQGLEQGETSLSPSFAAHLLDELENHESDENADTVAQLTPRQLEILQLVAQGVSYKDAGEALGLTERTIKYHMGNIVEILHLENRSQVIAHAAKIGIIHDN